MQRLVEIRRRMKAIEDIRGVARTMATVASAKLSRTRQRAAGMREYAERMREVLQRQQRYVAARGISLELVSPYFVEVRRPTRVLLVHLAGDRGMCGNYNVAINRLALESAESWLEAGVGVSVLVRGAKAESYVRRRIPGADIEDAAGWPREGVSEPFVDAVHDFVTGAFEAGDVDEVWCAYTQFFTPIRRVPRLVRLLPIRPDEDASRSAMVPGDVGRWAYEPSFSAIVAEMARMFVRVAVEDVLLESYASEQGARMITMEEATERASKRLQECRVQFNRMRREFITTDLLGVLFASRVRHA